MKALLTTITLALLLISCAPTIYISSQTDPNYNITRNDEIFIIPEENSSISERKFYVLLKNELLKSGFKVVDDYKAKYFLTFSLDQKTSTVNTSLPITTTSETKGEVGRIPYTEKTTSTNYIPYSYDYTVKKFISIYSQ